MRLVVLLACVVSGCELRAIEVAAPDLAVLPGDEFASIRMRIRADDPSLAPAVDSLRRYADAFLEAPIVTPLDKRITPPSGDKHDYLSRAPYFWPNPNTTDGLPYVKRDGQVYDENRTGTDFDARTAMDHQVLVLAQAYYFLDDERYAVRAAEQVRAWFLDPSTRMNPHLEYSQGVPGIMDGSEWGTIDNWRWPVLLDAIRLLDDSDAWTSEDREELSTWMQAYSHWLETSELGTRAGLMWNNHGTFLDAQRAAIALYAGDDESAAEILERAWNVRIDHGIEGDGRQLYELERTRSFGYSNFNLRAFFNLAALGRNVGLDLWNQEATDGSSLRSAALFLGPYGDTRREWPYVDIRFEPLALLPVMRWAYVAYGEDQWLDFARAAPGYADAAGRWPDRPVDLYHIFLPR